MIQTAFKSLTSNDLPVQILKALNRIRILFVRSQLSSLIYLVFVLFLFFLLLLLLFCFVCFFVFVFFVYFYFILFIFLFFFFFFCFVFKGTLRSNVLTSLNEYKI